MIIKNRRKFLLQEILDIIDIEALEKQFGLKIDKRKMDMKEPIRALGYRTVTVKLHHDVEAKIRIHTDEQ